MAANVFGAVIDVNFCRALPEFSNKAEITRFDMARTAMKYKNAEGKDSKILTYVQNLKEHCGDGIPVLCVVYNATGETLTHITDHDWNGLLGNGPYPALFQNGQWGGFLHVNPNNKTIGPSAGVVFGDSSRCYDWMFSWSIQNGVPPNKAYTEAREAGHFTDDVWPEIQENLRTLGKNHFVDDWAICASIASVGEHTIPIYEGIMTLQAPSDLSERSTYLAHA